MFEKGSLINCLSLTSIHQVDDLPPITPSYIIFALKNLSTNRLSSPGVLLSEVVNVEILKGVERQGNYEAVLIFQ